MAGPSGVAPPDLEAGQTTSPTGRSVGQMDHEQLMYLAQRHRPPRLDPGVWHVVDAQIDHLTDINFAEAGEVAAASSMI